ncbi:hypothetical protein OESDEN_12219 [Oesophagostomum dentatum]|uniref:Uncharacterized protein n=1 Tax=Oesophagostomum dentatum TaxID=61180 RepID=A0A0B1SVR8_OESDE|nr:hypothetical protein OESDEN_12219 [Oesophagostomum dentatum]
MVYNFSGDPEELVKERIHHLFGYDVRKECVGGSVNAMEGTVLFVMLHQNLPIVPVYIIILLLRRSITKKLREEKNISEKTRRLHSQLLMVSCILLQPERIYPISRQSVTRHVFQSFIQLLL